MELCNMLSFGEFIQLKNKDINGSDIRKSEYAGIRAILEVIKENIRFVVDVEKRNLIEDFVEKMIGGNNGNCGRNKDNKKK